MAGPLDIGAFAEESPAPIGTAYRNKVQVVSIALGSAVVAAVALGSALAYPSAAARAVWWVVAGLAAISTVRAIRSGIFVGRAGLLVRAIVSTRLCRWEDIAGFAQVSANAYKNGAAYIAVRLTDGSYVKTSGLTGMRDRTFACVVLGELNEHLQAHHTGYPSALHSPSNRPDDAREVP